MGINKIIEFIQTEKKNIVIEIDSIFNEQFTITSANFTFKDSSGNILIDGVEAEIDGQEIYYLLDTTSYDTGRYVAEFQYVVNTERLITRIKVAIIE